MIAITNILYKFWNLILKFIFKFIYEQDIDNLDMTFVVMGWNVILKVYWFLEIFLVAYFYELTFSRALLNYLELRF